MKTKKGFLLVEALISLMLIGILIVTVCSINLTAAKIKSVSKKKDEAFNTARGICEMYKSERGEFKDGDYKTLYKPINSIDEITSIDDIIKNGTGAYSSLDSAVLNNKKYVVMINLAKKSGRSITKGSIPNIDVLKVKVYVVGKDIITMTEAR